MTKMDELIERIEEMQTDLDCYELPEGEIRAFGPAAVGIRLKGEAHVTWFPYSQLRHRDSEVYASKWFLAERGLM